jgi:F-type H+-transporting ATPase subunit b
VKTIISFIVGVGLMVLGTWYSQQPQPEFITNLSHQGIPINPGGTIAVIGVFLILFPVIRMFFVAPLSTAIHARTTELERTFSEAEQLRAEMTAMRTEYEQRIAKTEADAREQIQAQIKEAQALGQQLRAEAAAQKEQMIKSAQQEIEQEKHRVMTELRTSVVDLTLAATEKILGANVDRERNAKLVTEFIDKVEVPS